uniref:C-type lectin domain-containing protein n=1 Tax=Caenorhabditis tropicalis TaxID=1561998 RepID=A0A1I7UWN3_9PELO
MHPRQAKTPYCLLWTAISQQTAHLTDDIVELIEEFETKDEEFTFSDPLLSTNPTGYVWGDKQPSGKNSNNSNCIYAQFNTTNRQYQTMGIDDYTCEVTMSVMNWTVYTGYVCGMTPSYLT